MSQGVKTWEAAYDAWHCNFLKPCIILSDPPQPREKWICKLISIDTASNQRGQRTISCKYSIVQPWFSPSSSSPVMVLCTLKIEMNILAPSSLPSSSSCLDTTIPLLNDGVLLLSGCNVATYRCSPSSYPSIVQGTMKIARLSGEAVAEATLHEVSDPTS